MLATYLYKYSIDELFMLYYSMVAQFKQGNTIIESKLKKLTEIIHSLN